MACVESYTHRSLKPGLPIALLQLLLDGVTDYLPCPLDVPNYALDADRDEERVELPSSRGGACLANLGACPVMPQLDA